jgi:hypothetical protein
MVGSAGSAEITPRPLFELSTSHGLTIEIKQSRNVVLEAINVTISPHLTELSRLQLEAESNNRGPAQNSSAGLSRALAAAEVRGCPDTRVATDADRPRSCSTTLLTAEAPTAPRAGLSL